jgi:hypothetical protein
MTLMAQEGRSAQKARHAQRGPVIQATFPSRDSIRVRSAALCL